MIFFTLVVQREKRDGAEAREGGYEDEGGGSGRDRISHTFTLSLCRTASLKGIHRNLVDILQTFCLSCTVVRILALANMSRRFVARQAFRRIDLCSKRVYVCIMCAYAVVYACVCACVCSFL